jgi:hypothetical protein
MKVRWMISDYSPPNCGEVRRSSCEKHSRFRSICSEDKSQALQFPTGYKQTVLMTYQGDMAGGSNECMCPQINSLADPQKCIFIFEISHGSEKTLTTFSEFKAFCEWREKHYSCIGIFNPRRESGMWRTKTLRIRGTLVNITSVS